MKLFIVLNSESSFLSHRLPIALEALKQNYDVTILAFEEENKGSVIRSHGLKFIALPSQRGGKNPLKDLMLVRFLYNTYRKEHPDIVHHVAIKATIYGTIAAKLAKVKKIVNALPGLGSVFINPNRYSILYQVIRLLYRYCLTRENVDIIAQNKDDIHYLHSNFAINLERTFLIRGSGVNLNKFVFSAPTDELPITVVLLSRMLWDKGIGEYVKAASILKREFKDTVRFIIAGNPDIQNPSGISLDQLNKWNASGNVEWIGHQEDIVRIHKNSHISVLPSYREGLPKCLLEALATGRPIVTTDVPGCREVVDQGINGYLVKVRDEHDLMNAMHKLISNSELRYEMGKKGREKAEREFSIDRVVQSTLAIYEGSYSSYRMNN